MFHDSACKIDVFHKNVIKMDCSKNFKQLEKKLSPKSKQFAINDDNNDR